MGLPLIVQDKANHFIYGFVIFVLCSLFLNDFFSLLIVAVVALAKEVYDEWKYSGFDIWDAVWTVVPAIILLTKNLI